MVGERQQTTTAAAATTTEAHPLGRLLHYSRRLGFGDGDGDGDEDHLRPSLCTGVDEEGRSATASAPDCSQGCSFPPFSPRQGLAILVSTSFWGSLPLHCPIAIALAMVSMAALDRDVLRCLDSCDELLALHHSLSLLLRHGWLDMARARYSLGPSRVSQPLFSLKPHSASALLLPLALPDDNPASPSPLRLVRLAGDAGKTAPRSANSDSRTYNPDSGRAHQELPSRSGAAPPDWSHDEDVAYRRLMAGEGDSDSDSEAAGEIQANEQARPLRWFGAFVSPHLQAAQTSFDSALEVLVKIANAQRQALHAHNQVMQQRSNMVLDEPSSAEAQSPLV